MRREERVTVQGPVKEQQPDGMSHRGWGWGRGLGGFKTWFSLAPTLGPMLRCAEGVHQPAGPRPAHTDEG